jgi:hypothetical protein
MALSGCCPSSLRGSRVTASPWLRFQAPKAREDFPWNLLLFQVSVLAAEGAQLESIRLSSPAGQRSLCNVFQPFFPTPSWDML